MYAILWAPREESRYHSMSIGCSRYFLRLPSRMSRAIPVAKPGMLENMRLTCTSNR